MAEHWYKNAIIYCLDVKTFADGNGDGIGDFVGLGHRLDYLAGLNVDCIWLQPFYPSPMRDNGYDITDYYNVDPRVGTLGDFVEFSRRARDKGMRVMIDLVVNHTSIDHPWFQAARSDPASPYREYYVWSEDQPPDAAEGTVFPGEQHTTWTWDREAKAYYFHRFYNHQAELNITNPAVRREIEKITGFWLHLGVTGFRVDALPFLIELKGLPQDGQADPHDYLRELRHHVQTLAGDSCLMAEANLLPEQVPDYFGDGDKIHMSFNFWVNQHLFLALARKDASPILKAYAELPPLPAWCQWNNFLRSHDELDLGRLQDKEREEVFRAFGPEPSMQLYGRGIRRRLAPMLGNDRRRLELAHSLMLTLPGTPVLRYGDELGMGDDLSLPDRESVRTPMQWTAGANGGFSTAPPERLALPPVAEGEFGYPTVNVEAQRRDPQSLLNWLERVIRRRKECPEFGTGACTWIDTGRPEVLAHRCDVGDSTVFAIHNLGARRAKFLLPLSLDGAPATPGRTVHDVLADHRHEVQEDGHYKCELEPWGYRWLRCARD
ncbi:alpha-amylase family protein [Aquabacterium sp. A7-Y]|uniref:alpha-amylase family protein n=1 Tax=Aquabacterium sp. A7-Y TaxID=1349605 RepID=UPI00223D58CF|nr:alpha-amylase family protein [Aquabacterium sp. A7-Y]MCW7540211.1 alpha-amylase family protein [Aquabacterium sp. A7-Y]